MQYNDKKILLFIPNSRWNGKKPWIMVSYAALIITSMLKNKFEFEMLDANGAALSKESCAEKIKEYKPKIVLITTSSVEYYQQCHDAVKIAKEAFPECIVIVGGIYPTVMEQEVLERDNNIDYIMIGHAEERLDKFLNMIFEKNDQVKCYDGIGYRDKNTGNIVINPVKSYIADVIKQVKPDYSKINMNFYIQNNSKDYQMNSSEPFASIITSYGCPYRCVFCASHTISGKNIAYRPIEDVIEERDGPQKLDSRVRWKNMI